MALPRGDAFHKLAKNVSLHHTDILLLDSNRSRNG